MSLVAQGAHFAIAARVIDAPAFSGYVAATALVLIGGALAEFGLVNTALLAHERYPGRETEVLESTRRANAILVAVSLAILSVAAWMLLPRHARLTLWLLLPWLASTALQQPLVAYRRYRLEFGRLASADLITRGLPLLLGVPLLFWRESQNDTAAVAVVALGLFVGGISGLLVLRPSNRRHSPRAVMPALTFIRQAVPLGGATAVSLVHTRIDQLVLSGFGYAAPLAAYGVAYRPLDAALALAVAAGGVMLPALARAPQEQLARVARQQACLLGALALGLGSVTFALAPQLVSVLGGSRYASAIWLTRLLSPALVMAVLNMGVATVAIAQNRGGALLRIAAGAAALNLMLNLALVGRYGPRGAAVATVVTETVNLLLVARLTRSALPRSLPWAAIAIPMAGFAAATFGTLVLWRHLGAAAVALSAGALIASATALRRLARGTDIPGPATPVSRVREPVPIF